MTPDLCAMFGRQLPRLTPANHRVTSEESGDYNCIAWAAHDTSNWWEPREYWPNRREPTTGGIMELVQLFADRGFAECVTPDFEEDFEKVALYLNSSGFWTHGARQLSTGRWTSKLGKSFDIEHDTPEAVAGGTYGDIFGYMKRPVPPPSPPASPSKA